MAFTATSYSQTCTPQGDQTTYGTNDVWIGYVYDNMDFTGYVGYVTQGSSGNPFFDQNFGGNDVMYATNGCSIRTETFSVRYKLRRTVPNGTYRVTLGGDDGYRLSLDGGVTWIIDNAGNSGSYTTRVVDLTLSGTVNAIIEYTENTGANRVLFQLGAVCVPMENQSVYGTGNTWRGYVYQGMNFETYKGMVTEGTSSSPVFDQSFGGDKVNYNTTACPVVTDTFSVRYRLAKTLTAGSFTFTLGADDGYRFSLDGGANWVINNWAPHSFTTSTYSASLPSGTYNMVIEYYERAGQNRVNFSLIQNTVLPVNLVSFAGKHQGTALELYWKVTDDSNPDYFEVEKSTEGGSFRTLGTVKATTATSYHFTDASLTSGNSFYRLKIKDLTGAVIYSNVISIRNNASVSSGVNVFPNIITGNSLNIETAAPLAKAMVIISDATGRQLNRTVIGRMSKGQVNSVETSVSKLPSGIYFLQVLDGNSNIGVQRFIVK